MAQRKPKPLPATNIRAGERIESQQKQLEHVSRYIDPSSGRPRKLAAGAMQAIQREFEYGVPTRELAQRYGVSPSLVLTICYFVHKGQPPTRPRPLDKRPVVMPGDDISD